MTLFYFAMTHKWDCVLYSSRGGNVPKFQINWKYLHEISMTKFHKVSPSFNFPENFIKFFWNLLNTTLKFHIGQNCYEISLKFNEISLKFRLNFTKVSIEISLKMSIEISEHYSSVIRNGVTPFKILNYRPKEKQWCVFEK